MDVDCSIIIPAFNAEKTIITCLDSLIAAEKSVYKFELIVVNDGSVDNTSLVVRNYSKMHKLVRVLEKANDGVSSARNIGIRNAEGKYVYFADSDDEVKFLTLEKMIKVAEENNCDMVIADFEINTAGNGNKQRNTLDISKNTLCDKSYVVNEIYPRFFINDSSWLSPLWNKLFSLKVIKDNGIIFDEKRTHGEDWAFCIDYLEHTDKLYAIDDIIYQYNMDGTQSYQKYSKNLEYCLIDGHKRSKLLNDKYCKFSLTSSQYQLFQEGFYYRILNFLKMDISLSKKERFLRDIEVKDCLKYLMKLDREQLNDIGFSRKDKVAFFLLYHGMLKIALKYVYKMGG